MFINLYKRVFVFCILCFFIGMAKLPAQGYVTAPTVSITDETRQLAETPQLPQQDITINAYANGVSHLSMISVRLFYRPYGSDFQTVYMQLVSDSLWTGTIPSYDVVAPYVEYYLRVDDGFTYGTDPVYRPTETPYRIEVIASNPNQTAPSIELTPQTARLIDPSHVESMDNEIPVSAIVLFDATAWSKSVTLFWRQFGQTDYFESAMSDIGSNVWQAVIPDSAVRYPTIEFYILAADNNAASTDPATVPQARPYVIHIASTSSGTRPPFVRLEEQTQNKLEQYLPSNTDILIRAFVVDDMNRQPHAVTLSYRHADRLNYKHISMQQHNDSLWTESIGADDVLKPGVHFYITAYFNDGSVTAPSTINPEETDKDHPYFIAVFTRNQPPVIQRTEATTTLSRSSQYRNQPITIEAIVTDDIFPYLESAHLYYRHANDRTFQHVDMQALSDSLFRAPINRLYVTPPGLHYYIYATDGDLESFAPDKLTWPDSLYFIPIDTTLYNEPPIIERSPETIALSDTAQLNGEPLTIAATIIDTVGHSLKHASLVYRHVEEGTFVELEMENVAGTLWQQIIPANAVADPGIEYFITADDGVAQSFAAAGSPASQYPFFIAVMPPNPPPVIIHDPVTSAVPDSSIRIVAQVIDTTRSVAWVQLRAWNDIQTDTLKMGQFEAGYYTAVIPGELVVKPRLYYQIYARDNWGYSTESEVYVIPVGTVGTVLPNPFTPNQDGFNDVVVFSVPGLMDGNGSVRIYNQRGRQIRKLVDTDRWDGRNDNNEDMPPGVYIYAVTIGGDVKMSGTLTLIR